MRESRGVLHNLSVLVAAQIVAQLLNVIALVFLARTLDSHWFGVVQIGVAWLAYALITAEWGMWSLGIREISRLDRLGEILTYVRIHTGLLAILAAGVCALGVLILPLFPFYENDPAVFLLYLAAVLPQVFMQDWIGIGLERMTWVAVAKTSRSVIYALLILLVLVHLDGWLGWPVHRWVPVIFLVSFVGSDLVMAGAVTRWLGGPVYPVFGRGPEWRRRLAEAGAIGASIVTMRVLHNIDLVMLGVLSAPAIAGSYAAAAKLVFVLVIAMEVLWKAILPRLSRLAKISPPAFRARFNLYLGVVLAGLLPAALGGALLGPRVTGALYGDAYPGAGRVFSLLSVSYCLLSLGWYLGNSLIAQDRQRAYFPPLLASALLAAGASAVLIPRLAATGAAVAMLAGHTCLFLCTAIICRVQFGRQLWSLLCGVILALAVMALVLTRTMQRPLFLQIIGGGAAYALVGGPVLWQWARRWRNVPAEMD